MYAISREGRLVPAFLFQEQLCFVSNHIKVSQTDSAGITNAVQAAVLLAFPFHRTVTAVIDFLQGLRHFFEINIAGAVPYMLALHNIGEANLVLYVNAVDVLAQLMDSFFNGHLGLDGGIECARVNSDEHVVHANLIVQLEPLVNRVD